MFGGHALGFGSMGILWIVLLLVLAVLLWRLMSAPRGPSPPDTKSREDDAEEILRRRFARGEITEEEFRRYQETLRRGR